jgi:hypothetical protein
LLRQFQSENSLVINEFQKRLTNYISESKLVFLNESPFWNLAYSFHELEQVQPQLYLDFKQNSSLVILKGDLNYRKLLGDLNWPFETPLSAAIRGFKPTSLCAIRTLKSDLIANLNTNQSENENFGLALKKVKESNQWMLSGDYGLIQFVKI